MEKRKKYDLTENKNQTLWYPKCGVYTKTNEKLMHFWFMWIKNFFFILFIREKKSFSTKKTKNWTFPAYMTWTSEMHHAPAITCICLPMLTHNNGILQQFFVLLFCYGVEVVFYDAKQRKSERKRKRLCLWLSLLLNF